MLGTAPLAYMLLFDNMQFKIITYVSEAVPQRIKCVIIDSYQGTATLLDIFKLQLLISERILWRKDIK